jgi:hypothetical protein
MFVQQQFYGDRATNIHHAASQSALRTHVSSRGSTLDLVSSIKLSLQRSSYGPETLVSGVLEVLT